MKPIEFGSDTALNRCEAALAKRGVEKVLLKNGG